ncbi:ABC transporter permease [Actinoplanes subtropicus]|uniref:ABC transporter permease n=1 Tax=Actinoplanes subtropicus TaxID=543632 RepID=UPI0004C304BC|nr:ABC transporter permease [Actinoplanes subtropicus]
MLKVTLAGLRAHRLRLVATALAIVLGVGFVAGTLVFGDTARAALFDQFARAARNVDVAVRPPRDTLPSSTVDAVRAVPGVAAADGRMQVPLPLLDRTGKLVGNGDRPGLAISVGGVDRLRPYDVTTGRAPAGPDEAALDADTATRLGYHVGDAVTVLDDHQQRRRLTLVGLLGFGASKEYADQSVLAITAATITALTGATGYQQVVAAAASGVPDHTLADRVRAALPTADRVSTGDQYRLDLANDAANQVEAFLTVVLAFAVIACVVAAFVIYNTFTILIAQRVRELALLRCVGAGRRQLFGSVLLESTVVGLIGAAAGIGLGLAVAYGLFSGAEALGAPLPAHALVLSATPVLVALLLGVLVTMASAVVPAIRATRVPPLAALRDRPDQGVGTVRGRVVLVVLALLCGAGGTLLTVAGSGNHDNRTGTLEVIAGGLVNFLGVLLLSPLFVGPLTAVLGWLPGRLFGVPARLAAANARRNPGRTAATTAALMIGVGLMSSASVAVATVRQTATDQIAAHYPVDYVLQPQEGAPAGTRIPEAVATGLRAAPALGSVASIRLDPSTVDGTRAVLGTVDPTGQAMLGGWTSDLRPGSVVLFSSAAAARGKRAGDRVRITVAGRTAELTVAALAAGRSETGDAVVSWADFARLAPVAGDSLVLVKAAGGVSPAASRAAVDAVTGAYPLVSVSSIAQWRAEISSSVNEIITVVATLLAFAILIALIGIMNTLSLSVFERTRESAMVRALGLTRWQLRGTLLVEALLMGAVGALVGVGFGLLYGWATSRVLFSGFAADISIPVGQLLLYLAIAVLAAVVAAILPARRAARASIVAAMAET